MDLLNLLRPFLGSDPNKNPFQEPYDNLRIPMASSLNSPSEELEEPSAVSRPRGSSSLAMFRDFLSKAPKREQHELSTLGKILAGVAGFSSGMVSKNPVAAFETTRGLLDSKFNRVTGDYDKEVSRLGTLANLDLAERKEDNDYNLADADNRREEEMMRREGWETKIDENTGKLLWVNKITGAVREGPKIGVSFGEKNTANQDQATFNSNLIEGRERNLIPIRGQQTQANENFAFGLGSAFRETPAQRAVREQNTYKVNRQTAAANPIPNSRLLTLSPSQNNAAFTGALREILLEKPDYQMFVKDGNIIPPEGGMFSEPSEDDIQKYNRFVLDVQDRQKAIQNRATAGPPINPPAFITGEPTREEAIAELRKRGNAVTEETIKNAIELLKAGVK